MELGSCENFVGLGLFSIHPGKGLVGYRQPGKAFNIACSLAIFVTNIIMIVLHQFKYVCNIKTA